MPSQSSESLLRQERLFIVRKRSVKFMSISNPGSFTSLDITTTRKRGNASGGGGGGGGVSLHQYGKIH